MLIDNIEDYTKAELERSWDHLETLKLTDYVEQKMDEIRAELERREIKRCE